MVRGKLLKNVLSKYVLSSSKKINAESVNLISLFAN